jgi:acetoin utilization deacetylase AcuC-like enzyme
MRLAILYDDAFLDHQARGYHPERPDRLVAFKRAVEEAGYWDGATLLPERAATVEELARVHKKDYVESTLRRIEDGWGNLDPDTFYSPGSKKAALGAAGGGVDLATTVWKGEADLGLALVRPPGHHAETNRAMGFCIFNNVAVAAAALLEEGAERILIFDPDVHHGNATQHQFEERNDVLYVSFHQFPHYPGTGHPAEVGRGSGEGYTANVAFPWGATDADYAEAADRVLRPLAEEFNPDMILVSVGFDAHTMDPLSGIDLSTEGYAYLAKVVRELAAEMCDGKLALFLEGGYEIGPASQALVEMLKVLDGGEVDRPGMNGGGQYEKVIELTLEALAPHRPLGS